MESSWNFRKACGCELENSPRACCLQWARSFALFVVFTAAQVWNDNARATASVAQEASALKSVLVLSAAFPEESQGRLQTLIHSHIEEVATKEWPMMAHQSATLQFAPPNLVKALQLTLALTPSSQGQEIAQREVVVALES